MKTIACDLKDLAARVIVQRSHHAAGWAGKQAEVLNVVLEDVLHAHPISEQRMKEVLGHTPLQARSRPCSMHAPGRT